MAGAQAKKNGRREGMKKEKTNWKELAHQLDPTAMIVPLLVVVGLCVLFILFP